MPEFIAAIELGSSKITGIVGTRNSDDSVQILAYAKEKSSTSVRKGTVYNLNKTAQSLTSVINRLEGKLQCSIAKVYVGIGGQSLHTIKNTVHRGMDKETIVSENLILSIMDENGAKRFPDTNILDVIPQEYKVGNNLHSDPVGIGCTHIDGCFLNIAARTSVKRKLEEAFALAQIEVAELFVTPLTTATAVLTENEMRSGCALIDFGADTTTVAVYKDKILRYLIVLPLGGSSITRDITSLQPDEEEAEQLKIERGNAIFEENDELNDIVEARVEEIVSNVSHQLVQSGYEDKLISGLIITGGASNLKNIDEALRRKNPQYRIRHAGFVLGEIHDSDNNVLVKDGTQNALLGLLLAGTENCCRASTAPPLANKPGESKDLFTDDEALKKQEEEAEKLRKLKEEESKKEKPKKAEKSWFTGKLKELTKDIFEDEPVK